jgi:hypothetical protein
MTVEHKEPIGEQLKRGREEARVLRDELGTTFDELLELARKEGELARAELGEQMGLSRTAAVAGAAALPFAMLTLVFAGLALHFVLDEAMPDWAAAGLTALAMLALAGICTAIAYGAVKRLSIVPRRTMESVGEDVRWIRRRISFSAK